MDKSKCYNEDGSINTEFCAGLSRADLKALSEDKDWYAQFLLDVKAETISGLQSTLGTLIEKHKILAKTYEAVTAIDWSPIIDKMDDDGIENEPSQEAIEEALTFNSFCQTLNVAHSDIKDEMKMAASSLRYYGTEEDLIPVKAFIEELIGPERAAAAKQRAAEADMRMESVIQAAEALASIFADPDAGERHEASPNN